MPLICNWSVKAHGRAPDTERQTLLLLCSLLNFDAIAFEACATLLSLNVDILYDAATKRSCFAYAALRRGLLAETIDGPVVSVALWSGLFALNIRIADC
jgi:hypothetical protein